MLESPLFANFCINKMKLGNNIGFFNDCFFVDKFKCILFVN